MTPLYHAKKSDGRWFMRAFALLLIGAPAVAQQANVSAPLTADEVMGRVVDMNEVRAEGLEGYSSIRSYHLECHCLSHKQADMVVRTDYQAPIKKNSRSCQKAALAQCGTVCSRNSWRRNRSRCGMRISSVRP